MKSEMCRVRFGEARHTIDFCSKERHEIRYCEHCGMPGVGFPAALCSPGVDSHCTSRAKLPRPDSPSFLSVPFIAIVICITDTFLQLTFLGHCLPQGNLAVTTQCIFMKYLPIIGSLAFKCLYQWSILSTMSHFLSCFKVTRKRQTHFTSIALLKEPSSWSGVFHFETCCVQLCFSGSLLLSKISFGSLQSLSGYLTVLIVSYHLLSLVFLLSSPVQ